MYIPYSQKSTQMLTFTGNLFNNTVSFLESCGWIKTTSGIYTYLSCTSPQGFTSKVRLQNDSGWFGNYVKFTFGAVSQGNTYLVNSAEQTYQIIGNQCQFFLSRPGISTSSAGSVVCGGVPFVPPSTTPGEYWWACGDSTNIYGFPGASFRYSLLLNSFKGGSTSLYREAYSDDKHCIGSGLGTLRLETFTGAGEIEYQGNIANTIYFNDASIYIPAILAWGETVNSTPKIRGIIWDAMVGTAPATLDSIMTYNGSSWINFTDEYYYGSLYLLMPTPSSGNYTY